MKSIFFTLPIRVSTSDKDLDWPQLEISIVEIKVPDDTVEFVSKFLERRLKTVEGSTLIEDSPDYKCLPFKKE